MKLFEWFTASVESPKLVYPDDQKNVKNTTEFSDDAPPVGMPSSNMGTSGLSYRMQTEKGYEFNYNPNVQLYRTVATYPEVVDAIDEIMSEAVIQPDAPDKLIKLYLDDIPENITDTVKEKIRDEFLSILNMMKFSKNALQWFKEWYIDGRMAFEVVIEKTNPQKGIVKVKKLDVLQLKLMYDQDKKTHFYRYTASPYLQQMYGVQPIGTDRTFDIDKDLIVFVGSGLVDRLKFVEVSHIESAIKPINNLRNVEDAIIISRFSRSTEKRIYNIDVGHLPKSRAEAYMKKLMNSFRNRLSYNSATGEIEGEGKIQSLVESLWFAKTADGRGTTVDQLSEGKTLGELEDLYYFVAKLWRALKIPESRRGMQGEQRALYISKPAELERDEVKFRKFIVQLQSQFSQVFTELLRRQLVWKKVMTTEEFDNTVASNIKYKWYNDNHYDMYIKYELLREKFDLVQMLKEHLGTFITADQIALEVLGYTEDDWKKIKETCEKEKKKYGEEEQPSGGKW